jgi:uncharacterized protein
MFLDTGALFEESAWRGFALPLLQARPNPLVASIVLGVLWSAWHIPVKFDLALAHGAPGFPTSDYYGGSAPSRPDRPTVDPAR